MKSLIKSLSSCIESLLDDDDVFYDHGNDKKLVEEWIKDNYEMSGKLTISDDFVADCSGTVSVKNKNITSLTYGLFRWGNVGGSFRAAECHNIKSLEGAPKEVGRYFSCRNCDNLKSLEGAPEIVKGGFLCYQCKSMIDLNGAPEKVFGEFVCGACDKLKVLNCAHTVVYSDFDCSGCNNLTTLNGGPKRVDGGFYCYNCKNLKITDSDRKKYKIR